MTNQKTELESLRAQAISAAVELFEGGSTPLLRMFSLEDN